MSGKRSASDKENHCETLPSSLLTPPSEWSAADTRLSKALSYVLRHGAVEKGIPIRPDGYVKVCDLLDHKDFRHILDLPSILRMVCFNMKRRYSLAIPANHELTPADLVEDNSVNLVDVNPEVAATQSSTKSQQAVSNMLYIRALQGHSMGCIDTRLIYRPVTDPSEIRICVHGTFWKHWESVMLEGLKRMSRLHIHFARGLPGDPGVVSGIRSCAEVAIFVDVAKAMNDGIEFWLSLNDVILTEGVNGIIAPKYFKTAVTLPERKPVPLQPFLVVPE